MADNTTLRDELARDRTVLANERTLLSYGRTSLALAGAAVLIFKFTSPEVGMTLGALSLTAAALVLYWGIHSYRIVAARIQDGATDSDNAPAFSLVEVD